MPEPPERTALYRLYDADDRLLYVGIAKNVRKRWQAHEQTKSWWHLIARNCVEWLPSRKDAREAELAAMANESPLFNWVWHPDGSYTQGKYDDAAERDHAAEELRRDLVSGTLRPGDQIRTVQLGRRYGVSAISVAMALAFLPPGTIYTRGNYKYIASAEPSTQRGQ